MYAVAKAPAARLADRRSKPNTSETAMANAEAHSICRTVVTAPFAIFGKYSIRNSK